MSRFIGIADSTSITQSPRVTAAGRERRISEVGSSTTLLCQKQGFSLQGWQIQFLCRYKIELTYRNQQKILTYHFHINTLCVYNKRTVFVKWYIHMLLIDNLDPFD